VTGWDEHGFAVMTGLPIDRYLGQGDLQDAENCNYAPVSVLAELGVDTSHGDSQVQFRDGRIFLLDGTVLERGGTLHCVWAVMRLPGGVPVVSTPAEPREQTGPLLAPQDVLRAAADAADDAICHRLDHNQVIALVADAVWRLAYERGHAAGHGVAVAAVQRPDQAAYERGKAEQQASLNAARQLATQLGQNADAAIAKAYADGIEAGRRLGRRQATEAVRAQANLPDLVHFDRPSDFRKGVLSCLAALEARNNEGKSDA
jgi:hypothetical protein